MMRFVPMVSTFFLAAIFLYAGIDKAFHYDGFVNALASYAVVPAGLAQILAPAVIVAEVWIGLGLLWRPWRAQAALVGAAILGVFTIALAINQVYAPGTDCGCWFTFTLAQGTGMHIVQNLVFLGLALTLWWGERPGRENTGDLGLPSLSRTDGLSVG